MRDIVAFLQTDRYAANLMLMMTCWTVFLLMFQFLMFTREDTWPKR